MTSFNSVNSSGTQRSSNENGSNSTNQRRDGDVEQAANQFARLMNKNNRRDAGREGEGECQGETGSDAGRPLENLSDIVPRWEQHDGQPGQDQSQGQPQPDLLPGGMGDAILKALNNSQVAETQQTQSTAEVGRLMDQIAERVLVSATSGADQEVRIQLKDTILPGTEIRLTQADGGLQVTMVTESPQAYELLNRHAEALQSRLEQRLDGRPVTVQVSTGAQSGADHQGRSRQQRDIVEELNNQ